MADSRSFPILMCPILAVFSIYDYRRNQTKSKKMAEFHGFPILAVPILTVFTVIADAAS